MTRTADPTEITFEDVHAYLCAAANYRPRKSAKDRKREAAHAATLAANRAAFKSEWIAKGKPLDADGEPDLFAEFA